MFFNTVPSKAVFRWFKLFFIVSQVWNVFQYGRLTRVGCLLITFLLLEWLGDVRYMWSRKKLVIL